MEAFQIPSLYPRIMFYQKHSLNFKCPIASSHTILLQRTFEIVTKFLPVGILAAAIKMRSYRTLLFWNLKTNKIFWEESSASKYRIEQIEKGMIGSATYLINLLLNETKNLAATVM